MEREDTVQRVKSAYDHEAVGFHSVLGLHFVHLGTFHSSFSAC